MRSHIRLSRRDQTARALWVRSLLAQGKMPIMLELDSTTDVYFSALERKWHDRLREDGAALLNGAIGVCKVRKRFRRNPRMLTAPAPQQETRP